MVWKMLEIDVYLPSRVTSCTAMLAIKVQHFHYRFVRFGGFFLRRRPNSDRIIDFSISQVLGFDVDAINSVHFSNHTGYKHVKGQVLSDKELHEVFSGLEQNDLLDSYSHLLTGYIGKDSFLSEIAAIVKAMRQVNPELVYGEFQCVQ